jgi:prevent-host-death family protein
MERIGIFNARARFSELVERVEAGEEVILTRRGQPVVRMVAAKARRAGSGAATVQRIMALSKRLNIRVSRRRELRALIEEGRD